MKILVTGGAGYVGTCLVPLLLAEGHQVVVYDSLLYGGDPLLGFFRQSGFSFVNGDVRDLPALQKAAAGCDAIMHLAAIVGFPACSKYPEVAETTNVQGSRNVATVAGKERLVIYASTGSNYGAVEGVCTEESPLKPVSLYGRTKSAAEALLLEQCRCIALRFATAYGVSPRLRLDLLINDFVFRALRERYLILYESHFMRTFLHVHDIARSYLLALARQDQMVGQVYNVGDESQNFSKKQICEKIRERITDTYIYYADVGKDADQRNYVVSYEKLRRVGFQPVVTVDAGIDELIRALAVVRVHTPYANV